MIPGRQIKDLRGFLLERLRMILYLYPDLEWNFYIEFSRRFEVLSALLKNVGSGRICDIGASPFIFSAMARTVGYDVYSIDVNPEEYIKIAEAFNINVVKTDIERDMIPFSDNFCDAVVFSEVLEHLNPYYVPHTIKEINRICKQGCLLVLTTPNVASLFRRLKLLLGKNPIYRFHVKEYTMEDVKHLLEKGGFKLLEIRYSDINDKTFLKPRNEEELKKIPYIENFYDIITFLIKNPNTLNLARTLAYPFIKLKPSLRMLIIALAVKIADANEWEVKRWG